MSGVPEYLGRARPGTPPPPPDLDEKVVVASVAAPAHSHRRHAANTLPGIIAAYAALACIVVAALFALFKVSTNTMHTVTKTVHAKADVSSTSKLEAALGTPAQTIPGQQINSSFPATSKCDIYSRAADAVIVCHS